MDITDTVVLARKARIMKAANIGRRMVGFRKRLGLSMQDTAKLSGKSQATISRLESGKQMLNIHALANLASIFKVHPFALLSDDPLWRVPRLPPPETTAPARILGCFIAEARIRRGIPLPEAARRMGMSDGEMEAIESGFSIPSKSATEALAALYGQPRGEWFFLWQLETRHPALSARLVTLYRMASDATGGSGSDDISSQRPH